jgi:BolA protein
VSRLERIEEHLTRALSPEVLRVEDESHMHSVPKGAETHFKVVVVAGAFAGLSRVERHRLVNAALEPELKSGLHALTITSRTPDEWKTAEGSKPLESPPCLGGSKADKH